MIAPGVFLTQAEGPYKRDGLLVRMAAPLKRETLTATALLPYVLERGTQDLPDVTRLKRKLNALYGAGLSTDYFLSRFSRVLGGVVEGVDASLIGDGADISRKRTQLLLDVLFSPYAPNGAFLDEWVDVEREKLRETIRAVINDKRDYCLQRLTEIFFEGDERALPSDGYEEDLDGIDGEALYQIYRSFSAAARIEIVYCGGRHEALKEILVSALSGRARAPEEEKPLTAVQKGDEKRFCEEMDIEQAKIGFAFTAGRLLKTEEYACLRVLCALLGASPTSRLFVNVREKKSLCYYVTAQPGFRGGGGITVDCGVAHEDTARAREAILYEVQKLAQDGPTETEMQQVKLLHQNLLHSVADSSGSLAGYCYGNIVRYGYPLSPKEDWQMIDGVTKEQVQSLLREMHLNASCLLYKGEGNRGV